MSRQSKALAATVVAAAALGVAATAAPARETRDAIMHTQDVITRDGGISRAETWTDLRTGDNRSVVRDASGAVVEIEAQRFIRRNGELFSQLRFIRPQEGIWEQHTSPAAESSDTPPDVTVNHREPLESGVIAVSGHTMLDGRQVAILDFTRRCTKCSRWWVDEDTLMPRRLEYWNSVLRGVREYSYAPRTAADLAALWPDVPAGVSRVRSAKHRHARRAPRVLRSRRQ